MVVILALLVMRVRMWWVRMLFLVDPRRAGLTDVVCMGMLESTPTAEGIHDDQRLGGLL